MQFYDYKKFAILYVDDEEKSLKYFKRALEDDFQIHTATSAADGLKILQEHGRNIGIILTDQRMPDETGVEFLEKTRPINPKAIRMLVTAFSDLNAAIDAVNTGAIYKYITKPWEPQEFEITLKRAMEFYIVQNDRDILLREKLSALHKMVITDRVISLGVLAAGLGHHVRNAMVAIRTFIDLAPEMLYREQADLDELRHPEFWNLFYGKVQNKVKFVIDLLDGLDEAATTDRSPVRDRVKLHEVVADRWDDFRNQFAEACLNAEFRIPTDLPELEVDRAKFFRLIDLLFRDALISLNSGNTLSVEARSVTNGSPDPEIKLTVSDNGPGLPEDAVASLFDPFFLRADKPQEYGINLMACYFIIYHHGGRIEVDSQPGKGVKMDIFLPLKAKPLAAENDSKDFLNKVMLNDRLWEKLLATT